MKPTGLKNYGSIPHLSNSKLGVGDHFISAGQERILTEKTRDLHDSIFVFEKYDGSNVGVAKVAGRVLALTRAGYEATTSPFLQHHLFAIWVKERHALFDELLQNGERIVGEWMAQAHGIRYDVKSDPIMFFDYFYANNQRALMHDLVMISDQYQLLMPRMLHYGPAISVEQLIPSLNEKTEWLKSHDLPEGMVYRVERKGKVDFLAKWVRPDFPTGQYCINTDHLVWNIPI